MGGALGTVKCKKKKKNLNVLLIHCFYRGFITTLTDV